MPNQYVGRGAFKRAVGIKGSLNDDAIDLLIQGITADIEQDSRRIFIPKTQTRLYRWPSLQGGRAATLWLDFDLISVTTLQGKAQDSSPTTITNYFLEPANYGPPYDRVEIDLSSSDAFESGNTPQRSISIAGSWGYKATTRTAGAVASGLASDAAATGMVVSQAARPLIDVGDTLLIESEQVQVTAIASAAEPNNDLLNGALTASVTNNLVTVDTGTRYTVGEDILVDAEKMHIESISGNILSVDRQHDGTTLASHLDNAPVSVYRTCTITRAQNGTTAATHANSTAMSAYEVPADIYALTIAMASAQHAQQGAAWGRTVGTEAGERAFTGAGLQALQERTLAKYRRYREAAV
jgi:hypothetical protein